MSATSFLNKSMTVLDGAPHARGRTVGALRKMGYSSGYIVSSMEILDSAVWGSSPRSVVMHNSLEPNKPAVMVSYTA